MPVRPALLVLPTRRARPLGVLLAAALTLGVAAAPPGAAAPVPEPPPAESPWPAPPGGAGSREEMLSWLAETGRERTPWSPPAQVARAAKASPVTGKFAPESGSRTLGESSDQDSVSAAAVAGPVTVGAPGLGALPHFAFEDFELWENTTARVNLANGNLLVSATDRVVTAPGITSRIDRHYNGLTTLAGAFGGGWTMGTGQDVGLNVSGSTATFTGPNGFRAAFTANTAGVYTAPSGINADLVKNADGSHTLTYRRTGEKLTFSAGGLLVRDTDRNDVGVSLAYTSGRVTSVADAAGRAMTVGYTGGYVDTVTDPAGRVVRYQRDAAGRLRTVTAPDAGTVTFDYDATGRLSTITSPRGFTTRFGYDSAHRVTTVTRQHTADPWGPAYPDAVTRFAYTSGQTTVTDANGHDATHRIDTAGRVTATTDALGRTRSQTWTANSDIATTTDAMGSGTTPGNTATLSYDSLNNNTGVSLPTGAAASAAYGTGANCATTATTNRYQPKCTTDDAGNKRGLSYDAAGNLTKVTDTTSGGTGAATADYVRDNAAGSVCGGKAGMVCSSTDGNGNTTAYRYDTDGNLTSVDPPGPLGTTSYSYDAVGRLTAVVDGNGRRTAYEYDAADRLIGTTFDGADEFWSGFYADGTPDYQWDSAIGTWLHHVDSLGRTYAKQVYAGAPADQETITTVHDGVGNLLSHTDATGITTYRYDAANQLTSVTEPGGSCPATGAPAPGSRCVQFSYDRNGAETARVFPGGARQDTTRDNSGRPTRITAKNAEGTIISDIGYSYTVAGGTGPTADRTLVQRRTSHKEAGIAAGAVASYGYDSLRRLTAATERTGATTAASWAYTYDKAGNRLTQTRTGTTGAPAGTITTSYNAAHQITGRTGDTTTWTYDAAGSQTRNGATGATASYGDRQQALTTAGATFEYFGAGNTERLTRTADGTYTEYLDSALGLASQYNGTLTGFTRDPDGALVSAHTPAGSQYYLTDHLGSVVGLLDATGNQVAGYSYDPYGATRTATGPAAAANPHRYTGGYLDTATGLYKLGARYYDPTLGGFTQPDPSGQENNPYLYATGNPINFTDPTGLISGGCVGALYGAAVTVAGIVAAPATAGTTLIGAAGALGSIVSVGDGCGSPTPSAPADPCEVNSSTGAYVCYPVD